MTTNSPLIPVFIVGEVGVMFVVAWTRHIRQVGGHRLDLTHERVAHLAVFVEHVVGEVTHVQNGIVHFITSVVHQKRQRKSVLVNIHTINVQE